MGSHRRLFTTRLGRFSIQTAQCARYGGRPRAALRPLGSAVLASDGSVSGGVRPHRFRKCQPTSGCQTTCLDALSPSGRKCRPGLQPSLIPLRSHRAIVSNAELRCDRVGRCAYCPASLDCVCRLSSLSPHKLGARFAGQLAIEEHSLVHIQNLAPPYRANFTLIAKFQNTWRNARAGGSAAGEKPKATWVEPSLPAEIACSALTAEKRLRAPVFKGIREDLLDPKPGRTRVRKSTPRDCACRGSTPDGASERVG
jgi:hypothetical protein